MAAGRAPGYDLTRQGAPLSRQEARILSLLCEGFSNPEISTALHVSIDTVKYHLKHIFEKLGANGRAHAASRAHSLGLIGADAAR